MKVLITGATGLVGRAVVSQCLDLGISVNYLTTSKAKLNSLEYCKGFLWNPKTMEIDHICFEGVDAIINLVGASISKRWTSSYKVDILTSRTLTAKLLYNTILKYNYSISQVISASAIGIYPTSYTNYYSESSSEMSTSFLGTVVKEWELAVDNFQALGCKVCKIRIGLVFAKRGGALPKIVKPIRWFAGAAFGNGKQWQSWIHITDLAAIFIQALQYQLEGVYNGVAPNPVTNKELTKSIAKILRRPLILPNIPKFVMSLVLGEMHILLFESQRVSPQKIINSGFNFKYATIKLALEDLL